MKKSEIKLIIKEILNEIANTTDEIPKGWLKFHGDDHFNKWGVKPYNTVFTKVVGKKNEPKYDLTILKHDDGTYFIAHGDIIMNSSFKNPIDASKAAEKWYKEKNQN